MKNVVAAYHTICTNCASSDRAWEKMCALVEEADRAVTSTPQASQDEQTDEQHENVPKEKELRPEGFKVCAMCCKEKALIEGNENTEMDQEIEDQKRKMEQKLGRPLKLREQKAIERKVERAIEREKQRAKEERRRLREEATGKDSDHVPGGSNSSQPSQSQESVSGGSIEEEIHSDDEDDPFLNAIGGKEMLLTGEAYQQYVLKKRGELA